MPLGQRSLRISRVVENGERVNNRVRYDVPPRGASKVDGGLDRAVAETVVLRRWRQRNGAGRRFKGERLPPTMWRALPLALGSDVAAWMHWSVEDIAARFATARPSLKTAGHDGQPVAVPSPQGVHAIIHVLGADRLRLLVARHADPARFEEPGVPDLFLYAVDAKGRVSTPRFVEVKRPDESVRDGQREEIAFLLSLGVEAQVLRLIEAGRRDRPARRRRVTRTRTR